MSTFLICLAAAILAAGVIIVLVSPSGNRRITINGEGSVVTVRSAASGSISITFDPSDIAPEGPPVMLDRGTEPYAEDEPTLLEEFVDPRTSPERKREIARTFDGLCCQFKVGDSPAAPADAPRTWEAEGCDEVMEQPEPDD